MEAPIACHEVYAREGINGLSFGRLFEELPCGMLLPGVKQRSAALGENYPVGRGTLDLLENLQSFRHFSLRQQLLPPNGISSASRQDWRLQGAATQSG
ncbi:MAG: hypothetical protein ABSG32_22460 [Terriglobia bacterium]|jgi:hypothetical protein